jgi:YesN/AraC family two-component response regulator
MVSAMGQEFFIKIALTYGANDFIIKPFNKAKLLETMQSVLTKV